MGFGSYINEFCAYDAEAKVSDFEIRVRIFDAH